MHESVGPRGPGSFPPRLPGRLKDRLDQIALAAGTGLADFVAANHNGLAASLRAADGFGEDGAARRLDRRLAAASGQPASDPMRRAGIAGLMRTLPARRLPAPVPAWSDALFLTAFEAMTARLDRGPIYDAEIYAKDARLVAGVAVPAGAQTVDIGLRHGPIAEARFRVRLTAMAARLVLMRDPRAAERLVGAGLGRRWLQIHTDPRLLTDFDEAGWDACYARIADILAPREGLAGVWGASWFFDPGLAAISPRLAYLQARPYRHGAIFVRLGPGASHDKRAAETSPTRRALIAAGAWRPICHAMFWPRPDLLAWAASRRAPAVLGALPKVVEPFEEDPALEPAPDHTHALLPSV